jgi:putative ABC transport system permease protein
MNHDVRYALRMMKKNPLLTFIIVMMLAVGIGANVAIFTAVDAVLLQPPAVKSPDQLVMVWDALPNLGERRLGLTAAEYANYSANVKSVETAAGFINQNITLTGGQQPERLRGTRVSANLFPLLGVNPSQGRTFSSKEDQANSARVAILSDGLWRKRYNADPTIVGTSIEIDRQPYSVIGVMPPSFVFPLEGTPGSQPADLWTPLALTQEELRSTGANFNVNVIARLKPGISTAQAGTEAAIMTAAFHRDHPELNTGNLQVTASAMAFRELSVENVRPLLLLLLGAVGAVLLIACSNVANLLLAKSLTRSHEIALRIALGAQRFHLIKQLLVESTLLAFLGALSGLALALIMVRYIHTVIPQEIGWPMHTTPDMLVVLFTLLLAIVTGIGFGLAPALRMSRLDLNNTLRESSNSVAGATHRRLRNFLAISETALSVLLLIGAGLLINSFLHVLHVSPGFNAQGVLTAHTVFDQARYPDYQWRVATEKEILARLATIPGITSVASSSVLPLDNEARIGIRIDSEDFKTVHIVDQALVSNDYFRAMGIPLLRGRAFSDQDTVDSPHVAIINESFARHYWPQGDLLGRRLQWGRNFAPFTVVGVVTDVRVSALEAESLPMVYMPRFQINDPTATDLTLIVSTTGSSQNYTHLMQAGILSVDKDLPLFRVATMKQIIAKSLSQRRFSMVLLSSFSLISLLLAISGLYAVISYLATERTREFGVRMALGAPRSHVLMLVMRQASNLVAAGLAIGVAAAILLSRFMHDMVYDISPLDPVTFIGISLLFCIVAVCASFVPAFRASQNDPITVLKPQ